ncbi:hypothetical protein A3K72_00610 [Candidatus Woesearchaeota archaeon RBG_13_36_6]|nr:MAG: hypothetical protein A3K72_00610 [Candidatus Woesearchaeota archaeon RBG_13_36_6]
MSLILDIDTQEIDMIPSIEEFHKIEKDNYRIKEIRVRRLAVGDYAVGSLVGVERKFEDYIGDLYSGKLRQQLKELRDNYKYPYLFIQFKSIDEMAERFKVSQRLIVGSLASISAHSHVPWILTGPYFATMLYKIVDKHYDGKDAEYEEAYSPIRKVASNKQFQHNVISSAYHGLGISTVLAKRLIERFESPQAVFSASKEELMEVKGIGKEKATKMWEVINARRLH